jgi:hypothetical protein
MKPLCRETRDCEIWPDPVRDPRSLSAPERINDPQIPLTRHIFLLGSEVVTQANWA